MFASQFNIFYEVKTASLDLTDESCLSWNREVPQQYDGGEPAHQSANPKERYRQAYFVALELVAGEEKADLKNGNKSVPD